MKRFFVTLLFLFPILLSAEGIPYNAAQLLLKSNLIVHGKVHRDEGKVFRLYVKEVWQDDGYGIKSGDYLKVRNTAILNCGLSNNLTEEVNEGVFFLKKESNIWAPMNANLVPTFHQGKASLWFQECSFSGTPEEWRTEIAWFRKEFFLDDQGNIAGKHSLEEILTMDLPKLTHDLYRRMYPEFASQRTHKLQCEFVVPEEPEEGEEDLPEPVEDTTIFLFAEQPAAPIQSLEQLVKAAEIYVYEQNPTDSKLDIEGRIYCRLIIEKDGKISRVEILKSPWKAFDHSVIDFFLAAEPWTPAKDRYGNPIRYGATVPVRVARSVR